MSGLQLRSELGCTQSQLARETMVSERTIRRIEKGLVRPQPATYQRLLAYAYKVAPQSLAGNVRVHRLNAASVRYYMGRANGWRRWSWRRRGQFLRWKRWYTKVYAEAQVGRCLILYRTRYRDRDRNV